MGKQKYFLGLDIGTDSIGFAATDENYNILKKGKKDILGIRLFDDAQTAVERRVFRASRRRMARKKERNVLLRELFASEIEKVDMGFYLRLNESMYHEEDKTENSYNSIFNDNKFTDKEYYKKYPTSYHLRYALINGEIDDVRMLYLGIAHILRNRGHFLFAGMEFSEINDFSKIFNNLNENFEENYPDFYLDIVNVMELENILKDKSKGTNEKEKAVLSLLRTKATATQKLVIRLMVGGTVEINKLFENNSYDEELKKKKICFKNKFDEIYPELQSNFDDEIIVIDLLKSIYDWSVLSDILKGEKYLSLAKIKNYNEHEYELKMLKKMVKTYIPNEYKEIFISHDKLVNYPTYINMTKINGKKIPLEKAVCSQEDLCKYLLKKFDKIEIAEEYQSIIKKIEANTLLSKQRVKENSVIPYQVHLAELKAILKTNEDKFPFLKNSDGKYTVSEKIEMIFMYRIPYYVGPLNGTSNFAWIVKNSNEKITPYNFDEVVNKTASAEAFIRRMTSKCTYLKDKDVLCKSSILYSKFMVLNELNNLKINGDEVSVSLKQEIFENLFLNKVKVTKKALLNYLVSNCHCDKSAELTGFDGDFKANMKSYIDFKNIFGIVDVAIAENIIKWITLFSEDKKILKAKISENYKLDKDKLNKVLNLKYKDFGKLSAEFLNDIYVADNNTGEGVNIISALYNTNFNLMQLLSNDKGYINLINQHNNKEEKDKIAQEDIKSLYCSPAVKKSIWQSVLIVNEIEKILGSKPEKLFIEVTRSEGEKGDAGRKKSRKFALLELYKNIKTSYPELFEKLNSIEESDLRNKKIYLYFTQLGRCAYTDRAIDFNDLLYTNMYDIEHIYPRSKTKDDSIHNNLVLVYKTANLEKTNAYPIPSEYRQNTLWKTLFDKKLINEEKYKRLTRVTPFEDKELEGFIARQLVETSQATKAVAEIFKEYYKNSSSEVCYVKANHVSDFRKEFDFIKCRDVNDYHHARDAYLNVVVGNVFDTKFTKNFYKNISSEKYTLNPEKMYKYDVKKGEYFAWKAGDNCTIKTIKKVMSSNKILFTRKAYKATGMLFDQTIYKKGQGEFAVKNPTDTSKQEYKLTDISKYGSFKSIKGSYFCVVQHELKGKIARTIEYVPIYLASKLSKDENALLEYCKNNINLINPKITFKELKINSLLNIDGFPMHLSGRTGNQIVFKGAVQLNVDEKTEKYLKKISNYVARDKANIGIDIKLNSYDKITKEENLEVYDLFISKLQNAAYKVRLSSVTQKIIAKREKFTVLTLEDQCKVLSNMILLFACNPAKADLSLLKEGSSVGTLIISKNITKLLKIELINQSVTGIYENKIDLLK